MRLPIPVPRHGRIRIYPGVAVTGLIVLAVDQLTKAWVNQTLGQPGEAHSVQVVGDFVRLSFTTNTGAAFGMFPAATLFFTVVALVAVPILLVARSYVDPRAWWMSIVFGMMMGGALGNLVDRIRLGRVTDFIDVGVGSVRWWAINVADASFVVGVALLALYLSTNVEDASDTRDARTVAV